MSELAPLRRNRDFVLLQVGQLFSSFGSNMSRIAYPLLALAVTGSAADAGYVSAVLFAPMLVLNLVAGVVADRFERRRLMIVSDVVAAAALGILAAAVIAHSAHLWLILLVAGVDSAAGVFFRAGQSGAFRAVVPLPQIAAAASVVQARLSVVRLGAPPVGGALFAVTRALPFIADAASYAFSTGSLLLMRARFQEAREPDRAPLRRQLAEGVSFFMRIPFLRTTMLMVAVSNFTVTGIELAVIVLAKRDGLPGAAVGGFIALTGATTLLGSLASPLLRRVLPMRRILLAEYWAAVAYAAFVLWPNVYVLAAAFAAQAFCFPNTDAAVAAYSYALIPDRLIGRAMSASNTMRVLATPLGPLAAGLLLASATPRTTIVALAAPTVAVAVLGSLSKAIREVPPLPQLTEATTSVATG
ncbi:MAG TPA: MFS transporter [Acidothermaceae bacterium]|nr:MFS transporter [Acidothermaceae bacterium]